VYEAVLFDLGKVLLDWDPRYFYARFFPGDEAGFENFMRRVVAPEWILEMDAGKPAAEAIEERSRAFPEHAALIALWPHGWPTMLRGEIAASVAILGELRGRGHRLFALTNFSTETFPVARGRHGFLGWFEDIVVSGEHGIVKPDPRIYRLAIERCRLDPARTVFVDDSPANVAAGRAAGLHALHFTTPERLRAELAALGLL
jgi:2-haloacid dehalogenase